MLDSEDSMITYTTVSSPYEGRPGDVSPGVDGPPVMPEDPYAYVVAKFQALPPPDYVPGPEEPEQAPSSPEEEEEPAGDDADEEDEEQDEDDDDEEEEHPSSANSIPPPPALHYGFVDSVEAEIRRRRAEDIGYGVYDPHVGAGSAY
nr:hypothetical protein [Tanacetum cinerariifolium]